MHAETVWVVYAETVWVMHAETVWVHVYMYRKWMSVETWLNWNKVQMSGIVRVSRNCCTDTIEPAVKYLAGYGGYDGIYPKANISAQNLAN